MIKFIDIPVYELCDTCTVDFAFPPLDKATNGVCVAVT